MNSNKYCFPHNTSVLFIVVLFSVFVGCGEIEETLKEETSGQQERTTYSQKKEEPQNEDDAFLSSFIGPKESDTAPQSSAKSVSEERIAMYEKQLQDLQSENAALKQKIMRVEQENRNLTLRLSDTESKLALEKERADRAELQMRTSAGVAEAENVPARPSSKSAEVLTSYEEALKAFNNRKYETALRTFQTLLERGVSEDMRDNCIYWIGECRFALGKYSLAIENFKEVLEFRQSEKKADAQFMLAQCYDRLGQKQKAKEAYEQVVKNYPMSKNVKRAKARWAQL
ncbi:MAG: tetratricopeptide repeat protein [Bacteroidetes bacterium]|nr:tetratricopeptide repeat protein [Bacteroidota bacterium]